MADDPAGSGAARFESFVREYQHMVFATAVRLLGNPADAEDVAQTVFLRAFERFAVLSGAPNAAGWLRTVTTNLCLNHLSRYRARWQFFSELDEDSGGAFADQVVSSDSPSARLEQSERAALVEHALWRLPDRQRVPLVLYHFEDMSYEQIATTLEVSVGKVKTDIHRGRESLKKALAVLDGSR